MSFFHCLMLGNFVKRKSNVTVLWDGKMWIRKAGLSNTSMTLKAYQTPKHAQWFMILWDSKSCTKSWPRPVCFTCLNLLRLNRKESSTILPDGAVQHLSPYELVKSIIFLSPKITYFAFASKGFTICSKYGILYSNIGKTQKKDWTIIKMKSLTISLLCFFYHVDRLVTAL